MKKIICFLLSVVLIFILVGCNSNADEASTYDKTENSDNASKTSKNDSSLKYPTVEEYFSLLCPPESGVKVDDVVKNKTVTNEKVEFIYFDCIKVSLLMNGHSQIWQANTIYTNDARDVLKELNSLSSDQLAQFFVAFASPCSVLSDFQNNELTVFKVIEQMSKAEMQNAVDLKTNNFNINKVKFVYGISQSFINLVSQIGEKEDAEKNNNGKEGTDSSDIKIGENKDTDNKENKETEKNSSKNNSKAVNSTSKSNKNNNQASSKQEKTDTNPCANGHNWVANTKTVHHDEVGHKEMVEVSPSKEWYRCPGCGNEFSSVNEYHSHFDSAHSSLSWMREEYTHGTIPAQYEEKWIVDKKAYDEQVTSYQCSVCGKTK